MEKDRQDGSDELNCSLAQGQDQGNTCGFRTSFNAAQVAFN